MRLKGKNYGNFFIATQTMSGQIFVKKLTSKKWTSIKPVIIKLLNTPGFELTKRWQRIIFFHLTVFEKGYLLMENRLLRRKIGTPLESMIWRGELLRLVPCMLVWHHQKNIFFLLDRAKLKLKTSNIYVTMKKKHSGQAPTLLVLIWDLSQFWPCHTNMLGFFKSLLSRNFCSEICWECLKNILLDIDEFQAEEASSLLILKAIFLS